jgi:LacI family transcriptional regulator
MSLDEVAKRAQVSAATVSRVLNNVGQVRSSTAARVLKAAEELRYHPNLHARTLAGGKSRTLGMIVSNMENPFFIDIYKGAEQHARAKGFEVVLANTDYNPEYLVTDIRLMIGRRVAGLALVISEMEASLIEELSALDMPFVFYDVGSPKRNISHITVNYGKGIEEIVDYLHQLGHRRMAFISHHRDLGPLSVRERAFRAAVEHYSPAVEWRIAASADGLAGGRRATHELISSNFKPTAIVCVNDLMALGALTELRDAGLRVPQDVSVTGFDNIALTEFANPSLSTLHIPRERIGQLMFQALTEPASANGADRVSLVIEPEFVIRESTGPAPAN